MEQLIPLFSLALQSSLEHGVQEVVYGAYSLERKFFMKAYGIAPSGVHKVSVS
jgi:hypothetical protein